MSPDLHPTGPDVALVDRLLDDAVAHRGAPFAIAGVQGCGKSTLAARLVEAARARGLRAVAFSIDDVYLDRPQRLALAREVHPLLATRGPPGTHDVPLTLETLDALLAGRAVRLPRFDKLDDARLPESRWPRVEGCDVVVMEGWCLKAPAQPAAALVSPVNELERAEDPDATWRTYCNDALARDYPALWSRLPRLLVLEPPGFHVVPRWRLEQEQALCAARPDHAGMTSDAVDRFVQHFERVSRHALATWPGIADLRLRIDANRRPLAAVGLEHRAYPSPGPTIHG